MRNNTCLLKSIFLVCFAIGLSIQLVGQTKPIKRPLACQPIYHHRQVLVQVGRKMVNFKLLVQNIILRILSRFCTRDLLNSIHQLVRLGYLFPDLEKMGKSGNGFLLRISLEIFIYLLRLSNLASSPAIRFESFLFLSEKYPTKIRIPIRTTRN